MLIGAGAREISESCVSHNSGTRSRVWGRSPQLRESGGVTPGKFLKFKMRFGVFWRIFCFKWASRHEIVYCSVSIDRSNDFHLKTLLSFQSMTSENLWAKSYLGAIGRNFVWATAALAPWLPRPWIGDKRCSDICCDEFAMPQIDRKSKWPKEQWHKKLFAMDMGKDIPYLSTENIKICGRTTKLEANAICLHFLPYWLNICKNFNF